MLTDQQSIELFHLLFLRVLKNNLEASFYAIKGGCNLRFFFQSMRYSEDLYLDVSTISQLTLKKKIDNILQKSPLHTLLANYGLEIVQTSSPKQTQTVQRWKVSIKQKNRAIAIPTKIEFSRRNIESERASEQIGNFVLQAYQLPPMILPHYLYTVAVKQKIQALLNRTETQARDIFDLYFLFSKSDPVSISIDCDLKKAEDLILNISHHDFLSQVVTYLLPEYVENYQSPEVWAQMQLSVIEQLKILKKP